MEENAMNNNVKEAVKIIGQHDGVLRNNDMLIKSMCNVMEDLIKFRYVYEAHASMDAREVREVIGSIKNSMTFMLGDLDVTMELLGIAESARGKADGRLVRVAKKMK